MAKYGIGESGQDLHKTRNCWQIRRNRSILKKKITSDIRNRVVNLQKVMNSPGWGLQLFIISRLSEEHANPIPKSSGR